MQSINQLGFLRLKGKGGSGSKEVCYREKNVVIFVGLKLKCYSPVPFHRSGKYLLCLVLLSLEKQKFLLFSAKLCCQMFLVFINHQC